MGQLDGKVAFITGAARGQGRAHAVKLASEGASIIAVDLCDQIASVPYPLATAEDMAATVKLVEDTGARIVAREADVRDRAALKTALREGIDELGRLDIVITVAKHGVVGLMRAYANFLAAFNIRVNSIHPAAVNTPMIDNEATRAWLDGLAQQNLGGPDMSNALPVQALEPEDIANAAFYFVSEAGRYVTGVALPVDAGYVNKR